MHAIRRTSGRGQARIYFLCNSWRVDGACDNVMSAHLSEGGRGNQRSGVLGPAADRCSGLGAPGVTRTPGTQFRKLLLYPPELRGRSDLRDVCRIVPRFCAELGLRPPSTAAGRSKRCLDGDLVRPYKPLASTMSKTPRRSLPSCFRSMARDGL